MCLSKKPVISLNVALVSGAFVAQIMRVRLALEHLQERFDAGIAQLAVHPHCVAEQQVARARGEDRRREARVVAVDRRDQRVLHVVAIGVDLRAGVAEAVARDQHVVDQLVGVEGVAHLRHVRHRRAGGDRARHRQVELLRAQPHLAAPARRPPTCR